MPYLAGTAPARLMAGMPSLRVAQTLTAGVDDVRPLVPEGVTLCNAKGVHDASTAELAVALALAALRGIPDHVRAAERGSLGRTTRGRRWPTAGCCSWATARWARRSSGGWPASSARYAGWRAGRRTGDVPVEPFEALAGLLPWAEVVILTVPMTDQTRGLVDARFLAALPDGALVVNVARGTVVVTDDLLAEVTSGRLLAALDVTDPEPLPPDHPLWSAPGVLISPHVGGDTTAFLPRALRLVEDQLHRYAEGRPLENVITAAY